MKKTITKKTPIAEIIADYPALASVLAFEYNMHCVGCMAAAFDTLEEGARNHGFEDEEITSLVEDLNSRLK